MFEMHRVYCANAWEMEGERILFYDRVGEINEAALMPRGQLFVPVSLPGIRDKRPIQYTVDENIRDCSLCVFILVDDWGPEQRDFRHDYEVAMQCLADPALPMRDVALLRKISGAAPSVAPGFPEPRATFSNMAEFGECVNRLLSAWAESLSPADSAR
jgi:hypothetical protein